MSSQSEFFLNTRANVVQHDLIEMSHPDFTQIYRIVRNAPKGLTVDLAPDELGVAFTYYPANIEQVGARDDLESSIRVDLGDLGEVVPGEVDAVSEAGGFMTKPEIRYWAFSSDQLSAPIYGPINLEVPSISFAPEGASFEAKAPSANSTKTGRRYTLEEFEMLRGFL